MLSASDFLQKVAQLQDELRTVADLTDPLVIEETAKKLEGLHYAPTVILPLDQFLRMRKIELLGKIEEIILLSDEEVYELAPGDPRNYFDIRLQFISTLVYYYKQLARLRRGVPDAWDEVDELYIHD